MIKEEQGKKRLLLFRMTYIYQCINMYLYMHSFINMYYMYAPQKYKTDMTDEIGLNYYKHTVTYFVFFKKKWDI